MPEQVDAFWHGQAGEQRVEMTGWIGGHPVTGVDVAHLMVMPQGHGIADRMRQLAEVLELARMDSGQPLPEPTDTRIVLHDTEVQLWRADRTVAHRDVPGGWRQTAVEQGYVVLSVGTDPLHSMADLDRYLRRTHRVYAALIHLSRVDA